MHDCDLVGWIACKGEPTLRLAVTAHDLPKASPTQLMAARDRVSAARTLRLDAPSSSKTLHAEARKKKKREKQTRKSKGRKNKTKEKKKQKTKKNRKNRKD